MTFQPGLPLRLSNREFPQTPIGLQTMGCAMPEAHHYHNWVFDSFGDLLPSGGRTLEIGTAYGIYTPRLLEHGPVVVTDLDPSCLEAIRRRLGGPNLECLVLDLENQAHFTPFRAAPCDSVVCLNVLEHVRDDGLAVRHMANALCPGGRLILYVPAMPILYGTMDQVAGHFRRYTLRSLSTLLEMAGLDIVRAKYQNSVGALGWWVNGRVLKQRQLSSQSVSRQIRIFDRYIVPISRLLDVLASPFFGQSILMVGQKR